MFLAKHVMQIYIFAIPYKIIKLNPYYLKKGEKTNGLRIKYSFNCIALFPPVQERLLLSYF